MSLARSLLIVAMDGPKGWVGLGSRDGWSQPIRIGNGYLMSHWCAFQLAAPSVGTLPFTLTNRLATMLAWAS